MNAMDVFSVVFTVGIGVGLVLWIRYMLKRQNERRAQVQDSEAQYDAAFAKWWDVLAREAQDPTTPPERLRALAIAALPADPRGRVGYIEILRLVANNPTTPPEIQGGLISRIGSEESAINTSAELQRMQQHLVQMSKKRGGGFIVGGGVSFPLD